MIYPFTVSIFGETKVLEEGLLNPDEDEKIIEIIESKINKSVKIINNNTKCNIKDKYEKKFNDNFIRGGTPAGGSPPPRDNNYFSTKVVIFSILNKK